MCLLKSFNFNFNFQNVYLSPTVTKVIFHMPKQSKSAWEALLGDATIDIDKADFIEARAAAAKSPRKLGAPSATGGSRVGFIS